VSAGRNGRGEAGVADANPSINLWSVHSSALFHGSAREAPPAVRVGCFPLASFMDASHLQTPAALP